MWKKCLESFLRSFALESNVKSFYSIYHTTKDNTILPEERVIFSDAKPPENADAKRLEMLI